MVFDILSVSKGATIICCRCHCSLYHRNAHPVPPKPCICLYATPNFLYFVCVTLSMCCSKFLVFYLHYIGPYATPNFWYINCITFFYVLLQSLGIIFALFFIAVLPILGILFALWFIVILEICHILFAVLHSINLCHKNQSKMGTSLELHRSMVKRTL